jgi:hydrogenase-4 membrane subunit HyfE
VASQLTSFFIASKISVLSSLRQLLIRARLLFSIIGLLLCRDERKKNLLLVGAIIIELRGGGGRLVWLTQKATKSQTVAERSGMNNNSDGSG